MTRTRVVVSGVLLVAGLGMVAHHFLFADAAVHPSDWLAALCIVLGSAGLIPVEFQVAMTSARELLPWKANDGSSDRRDGVERRSGEDRRRRDDPTAYDVDRRSGVDRRGRNPKQE